MKRKVIAIIIGIVCVIVAAVCLNQFVFSTKVTHIKDADNHKVQKAYDLLANAYLDDGEETEVYYTDFIKTNKEIGEGNHQAVLENGKDAKVYYAEKKKNTDDTTPEAVKI